MKKFSFASNTLFQKYKRQLSRIIAPFFGWAVLVVFVFVAVACSGEGVGTNEQTTKKLYPSPLVSKVYGTTSRSISISMAPGTRISWAGLIRNDSFRYFEIESVSYYDHEIGSLKSITAEGGSTAVYTNLAMPQAPSSSVDGEFDGLDNPWRDQLILRVRYSPPLRIPSSDDPHQATLQIVTENPYVSNLVYLKGYTQGEENSKCAGDPSAMEASTYELEEGTLDLYICDSDAMPADQINTDRGEATNLTPIEVGNITFYQPDDETICLIGNKDGMSSPPSIEDFLLPIPKGISELTDSIENLPVKVEPNAFAECSLDGAGQIDCPGIEIDVFRGEVPVEPIRFTTGTVDTVTPDCTTFGDISGSGAFGDDSFTLVGQARVEANNNTTMFNLDDASVVIVMRLNKP